MKYAQIKPFFIFYPLLIVFFFLDLLAFGLLQKPLLYFLLSFYILQLSKSMSIVRLLVALFLLALDSIVYYGFFGLNLLYIIPVTFLGIHIRQTFYKAYWPYYLLLGICLVAQIALIEYGILHLPISIPYTISTLFANIVLIWLMGYIGI